MTIYAIGDIQGCLKPLQRLLDHVQFDPKKDQVWFVGDLVNRGPKSLETLRFIKGLGKSAVTVLGNHDLHLLALSAKVKRSFRHESLRPILKAKDRDKLVHWLRHRPLMHRDAGLHVAMAHAGIYPGWSIREARLYAQEVENILQSPDYRSLLHNMYGNKPDLWHPKLTGWKRYRFIINAFTRMRYVNGKGVLNFSCSKPPGKQPGRLIPWYAHANGQPRKNWRIVYGHWSSAGHWFDGNYIALDSGCLWGEKLTAAEVDGRFVRVHQLPCNKGIS